MDVDPAWMNPERAAIESYFQRAAFAFAQAQRDGIDARAKSMALAFCLHACQSLSETLEARFGADEEMQKRVNDLPHRQVIELARHHDIHGHPLPVCEPNCDSMMMHLGREPIRVHSSQGVEVSWQDGRSPAVRTTPKSVSRGKIVFGGALTTRCQGGELYVQNPPSGPTLHLASAMREFLVAAQGILSDLVAQGTDESSLVDRLGN